MSGTVLHPTPAAPISSGAIFMFTQQDLQAALDAHVATLPPFLQPICRAAVLDFLGGETAKAAGLTWTPAPIQPSR